MPGSCAPGRADGIALLAEFDMSQRRRAVRGEERPTPGRVQAAASGCDTTEGSRDLKGAHALAAIAAAFSIHAAPHHQPPSPPVAFVEAALCVHSGWHYTDHWIRGERPDYVLWGHHYWRTWDVPDTKPGGSGEAGWSKVNSYGGGMQFTLGTWNRAAGISHGAVPYESSNAGIAQQPPAVQILAAWLIVDGQDHGSWGEWPQTSVACGLR